MNILDVMTKEDRMKPPDIRDGRNYGGYNLSAYFIKKHGREMGKFAGRWSRDLVEAYLERMFGQRARADREKEERASSVSSAVEAAVRHAQFAARGPAIGEKMRLQGGRKRAAA